MNKASAVNVKQINHSSSRIAQSIERRWYSSPGGLLFLLPLEWLFRLLVLCRKKYLSKRAKKSALPVIVVGNISVGGTGKTPVIIALVKFLREQGFTPGVISRGYGRKHSDLQWVSKQSSALQVGDEPLEIFEATQAPIVVSADRTLAARTLAGSNRCDIVLADDGLQHYRLARDLEIAVLDGEKRFGNGHCLPVGPLREPRQRLQTVDTILVRGDSSGISQAHGFDLTAKMFVNLKTGEELSLEGFTNEQDVYAVAGIGSPQKFFTTLEQLDLGVGTLNCIGFADHHLFCAQDFAFSATAPVVMTAKDAVKCRSFALENWWFLRVEAALPESFLHQLMAKINEIKT